VMAFIALVLSLFASPALLFTDDTTAEAGLTYRYGHVVARGVFLGPNDKPIFAEIGPDGQVIAEIGEAIGELEDAVVMDADTYRTLVQSFKAYQARHQNDIGAGATVWLRGGPMTPLPIRVCCLSLRAIFFIRPRLI